MPTGESPRVSLRFRDATPEDIPTIRALAEQIWWACYRGMIPDAQIEYMLERMYAPARIASEMAGAVRWELVEAPLANPFVRDGGERDPAQLTMPEGAAAQAGAIGFLAWEFEAAASVIHLHKLYLGQAHHGRGIGQAMLGRVRDAALARGAGEIRLRVNRANHRALAAYRRAGYTILEDHCAYIGNGFVMDDHILILRTA